MIVYATIYYQATLQLKLNPVFTPVSLIIMDQEAKVDIIITAQPVKVYLIAIERRIPTIMSIVKEVSLIGIGTAGMTVTIPTG